MPLPAFPKDQMDTEPVKFRGTPIYLHGKFYILPPLSVGQWEQNEKDEKAAAESGQQEETLQKTMRLICLAFSRNYPEINQPWLRDALDASTLRECIDALNKQSGLVARGPGE